MASIINSTTTAGVTVTGDNSGSLQLATNNGTTAVTIDTSQRVAFVAGTAALPAITTTSDTNTGIYFPAADTIAFTEGGAESMRIDSSGNVGIGTSSPSTKLHVEQSTTGDAFKVARGGNYIIMGGSGSGTQYIKGYESVVAFGNEFSGATTFLTNNTERMRVDSTGNVLVGITSTTGIEGAYISNLGVFNSRRGSSDGNFAGFFWNGTSVGSITTNGSTTAYNTSSDYRLKENISPMTGALAKVSQLKPVTYTWKSNGSDGEGFIAHELQAVVPNAVVGDKDEVDADGNIKPQGVDTSFLVATLTAAIQELNAKVDAQAVRIAELEGAR